MINALNVAIDVAWWRRRERGRERRLPITVRACVYRLAYMCVVDSTDERVDVLNVRKVVERRECARSLATPSRHHVRRHIACTYGHTRVRVNGEKEHGAGTSTGTEYRRCPSMELGYRSATDQTDPD